MATQEQVLSPPTEGAIVIPMKPGELKYIQNHCHHLLADMDQVLLLPLEDKETCGFQVLGPAVACQMVAEVLKGVVSSLLTKTIPFNAPGLSRFLNDKEGKSILSDIETKFQVHIDIKSTAWTPLACQDCFENGWQIMAQKNFQRGSVDGSAQELQSESMQISHGGVSEEEGNPVSDFTMDLSNNLEDEDAQLSLAASMESIQESLECEGEEPLEKVRKLSGKMDPHKEAPSGTNKNPEVNRSPKNILDSYREELQTASTVYLEVYAVYGSDVTRAHAAFGKKLAQRQTEERLENSCLRRVPEHSRMCLEAIKRKHGVEIDIKGTVIVVSGFRTYIFEAVWDVKRLLDQVEKLVWKQEPLKTVQWTSLDPTASEPVPYPPDVTVVIEHAWQLKRRHVHVLLDHQSCTIDFQTMQEFNNDAGRRVEVTRKLLDVGELVKKRDENNTPPSHMPETIKLHSDCDEYQQVVQSFYATLHTFHSSIRIIKVEKLMNHLLLGQYRFKKASMEAQTTNPEVERTLYHGTHEDSVTEICLHGFNRNFGGKNGVHFGQGVYFAVNSELSINDTFALPGTDDNKFVFVAKVLTGQSTVGSRSMALPPLMDESSDGVRRRYDSTTDNVTNPTEFVVFNDTQAFPQYLITCREIFELK